MHKHVTLLMVGLETVCSTPKNKTATSHLLMDNQQPLTGLLVFMAV